MINELVKKSYSKRERIVSGKKTFIKVFLFLCIARYYFINLLSALVGRSYSEISDYNFVLDKGLLKTSQKVATNIFTIFNDEAFKANKVISINKAIVFIAIFVFICFILWLTYMLIKDKEAYVLGCLSLVGGWIVLGLGKYISTVFFASIISINLIMEKTIILLDSNMTLLVGFLLVAFIAMILDKKAGINTVVFIIILITLSSFFYKTSDIGLKKDMVNINSYLEGELNE